MRLPAGFFAAFFAFSILPGPHASAQDQPPAVLVIDQERLFQESTLGRQISDELEQRSAELAAENRAIETELIAEERDLTERRSELEPEEFRVVADAFNEKVDRLRSEQDAKTRELVAIRDAGRQSFTQSVGPILLDYMRRTGASVMLDRRSVVATAERVDVTDELIAEIDARAVERADDTSAEPEDETLGGGFPAPSTSPDDGGAVLELTPTPETERAPETITTPAPPAQTE